MSESGIFVAAVVGLIIVGLVYGSVMYSRGTRIEGLAQATEKAAMTVDVYNEILRAWVAYAASERIEGLPFRIEIEWNHEFDWLESAVIVIRYGFKDTSYNVDIREHLKAPGKKFKLTGALTFELINE